MPKTIRTLALTVLLAVGFTTTAMAGTATASITTQAASSTGSHTYAAPMACTGCWN